MRDPIQYSKGFATLAEARTWVMENVDGPGAVCPCCGQLARMYRRRLSGSISAAACLIYREMFEHPENAWVHAPTLFRHTKTAVKGGGDYAKGVYWGILEEREDQPGQSLGWYRLTEVGTQYVLQQLALPEYLLVYQGKVQGAEGRHITVLESLANEYDYEQLLLG